MLWYSGEHYRVIMALLLFWSIIGTISFSILINGETLSLCCKSGTVPDHEGWLFCLQVLITQKLWYMAFYKKEYSIHEFHVLSCNNPYDMQSTQILWDGVWAFVCVWDGWGGGGGWLGGRVVGALKFLAWSDYGISSNDWKAEILL